ncbi:MAG: hypothetical protein CMJ49_13190 [Planctomycetaceae bacterium]|nr:hypothetical protein [Planctomycetaceae bacterium]
MVQDEPEAAEADVMLRDDVAPAESGESGQPGADSAKLVPVTESIRYRRRAQAAEAKLGELQGQFDRIQQDLHDTRSALDAVERRRAIDELLIAADTIDLETARLLTEAAVSEMDEPDVGAAVEELHDRKPFLFRQRSHGGGSMSPKPRPGDNGQLGDAAEHAAVSGDRRDLLRYLHLRRGVK